MAPSQGPADPDPDQPAIPTQRFVQTLLSPDGRFDALYQHYSLVVTFALVVAGSLGGLLALATDFWIVAVPPRPMRHMVHDDLEGYIFLWAYTGLWRKCIVYLNSTDESSGLLKDPEHIAKAQEVKCRYYTILTKEGSDVGHVLRTKLVFFAVLLMTASVALSGRVVTRPGYITKRLAGIVHLLISGLFLNIIWMTDMDDYEEDEDPEVQITYYGYSYLAAWSVLLVFLSAGFCFLCMSKRKRLTYDKEFQVI